MLTRARRMASWESRTAEEISARLIQASARHRVRHRTLPLRHGPLVSGRDWALGWPLPTSRTDAAQAGRSRPSRPSCPSCPSCLSCSRPSARPPETYITAVFSIADPLSPPPPCPFLPAPLCAPGVLCACPAPWPPAPMPHAPCRPPHSHTTPAPRPSGSGDMLRCLLAWPWPPTRTRSPEPALVQVQTRASRQRA